MSTPSAQPVPPPSTAPAIGSIGWTWDTFIASQKAWRATIVGTATFIAGAVLVVILMAIMELPGGVLPAIPVLTINLVPHSLFLLGKRLLIMACTLFASFLIFSIFEEQPWMLLILGMSAAYFGLYMVGRGLDMLSYLLAVAVPILLAWEASIGSDLQKGIWLSSEQLLVGLLVTGSLGIIFLQPQSERNLRTELAKPLLEIAKILRTPIREVPDSPPQITAISLSTIERLLTRYRAESGRTPLARNLHVVADTVRMIIGWNQIRSMLHQLHFTNDNYAYLQNKAMIFRNLLASQLEENADSLLNSRHARKVPGLNEAVEEFKISCIYGIKSGQFKNLETRSIAQAYSFLYEHCIILLTPMTEAIHSKLYRPPKNIPLQSREHRRPWSGMTFLMEAAIKPDPAVALFALKGVIVGMIGFALASVFSYWGGAPVLLLMALLLTPQSMGAVASSYMLRMLGLGIAVVVCLFGVVVVIPDINDPWTYGLLLTLALLPGAIASQNPRTIALGIGYCMSVFFMLTQPDHPSVDLTSIQNRFVSVAAATSLAWLVFIGIKPVYARQRIGEQLSKTCSSLANTFRLAALAPGQIMGPLKESDARWDVYLALDKVNHTITESKTEFSSHKERYHALTQILSILEQAFVLGRFEMRVRWKIGSLGEPNEFTKSMDRCLVAHADTLDALGEMARSNTNYSEAMARSQELLKEVNSVLDNNDAPLNIELHRCVLAQYAGVILLNQYCMELERLLKIRKKYLDKTKPFVISGTHHGQPIFAENS